MNTKKILIIASVALASIAAGYGLVGLRPAGRGGGDAAASPPLLGVDDGTPRVVYLDATASYRDDDDRWGGDDDRYEHEDGEHGEDDDGDHDDD
mgnify:CR=1 FL=1